MTLTYFKCFGCFVPKIDDSYPLTHTQTPYRPPTQSYPASHPLLPPLDVWLLCVLYIATHLEGVKGESRVEGEGGTNWGGSLVENLRGDLRRVKSSIFHLEHQKCSK
ncbi:hypothetical protein DM860_006821 [Cuscuta australis]|uniref:Uncharacterized protein n=1 Tax=Cuscuta australis TaxID=267555 RepID=A0A328E964_9ASTE|nr:hypothetical protein DM860_006821 [Cuscuta australis]